MIFTGKVVWFNNKANYGFIEWEKDNLKQKDMFVHFSDINMEGYKTLTAGQNVTFEIGANFHGNPKAINVTLCG